MTKILYFSRGRGYGHSMVDILIRRDLLTYYPHVEISMASYADGLRSFIQNDIKVEELDIDLDDEYSIFSGGPILDLIHRINPDLIISHEMFIAVQIAKKLSIPSILITHWFFEQVTPENKKSLVFQEMFNDTNEVIMIDIENFHIKPKTLKAPTTFVGPITRIPSKHFNDKKTRARYGLREDIDIVCLSLGGGRSKESLYIAKTTIELFNRTKDPSLGLIYFAGENYKYFSEYKNNDRFYLGTNEWDYYMDVQAIANIVITRGTFNTLSELATMDIPSISILDDTNPVDRFHAKNFEKIGTTNVIDLNQLTSEILLEKINFFRRNKVIHKELVEKYKNSIGLKKATAIISKYL
ncbi:UDP-N-acetylglucosamine--N-acetylmuramyl-(pentapeptide) pyrophosphoryl-undecaprenol N-acetylglucosamine transferase [Bacillaceae bacterium SIJ1]|uniref:UDP-N-acetylglucosamine--N-acetylmuramyl- (pentapeptide) pyrophosphoryl-undecaprenol N-acetylglucosamine transferase n=1 Tax=Litoribacterium kuwaitense TaxID=1398745 RepID=UPI0013EBF5F9|nr:UDP-N-acetylglucosamine--N-acetylmuramyl-(pentapeptide) pyrophosphoryl-undecaprenol N-acetylglucosamine transferase [Litoribacterium kuwaitense]NGP46915.1 UDP-N-acetylglucosamine--N-acetylmuramyl-(pentapeptide) pyrophosphoryl-undecaprenol N-acetylglucosamine transferase [Litoribacterium kuwaitense]